MHEAWRPFCRGWPGLMRSIAMPRRSHQTESLKRLNKALGLAEGHAIVAADGPLILFLVSSKFAPGMRIFRAKWGTLAREPKYETGERPRARPAVANFLQTPSSHFGSLI